MIKVGNMSCLVKMSLALEPEKGTHKLVDARVDNIVIDDVRPLYPYLC